MKRWRCNGTSSPTPISRNGWRQKDAKSIENYLDPRYRDAPTKIPAGRLELRCSGKAVTKFELNLATAEGFAWFADGTKLSVLQCDQARAHADLRAGAQGRGPARTGVAEETELSGGATRKRGRAQWFVQRGGRQAQVLYLRRVAAGRVGVVLAVAVPPRDDRPAGLARRRCAEALPKGFDAMLKAAWPGGRISGLNRRSAFRTQIRHLRQYHLVQVLHGATSPSEARPCLLRACGRRRA